MYKFLATHSLYVKAVASQRGGVYAVQCCLRQHMNICEQ